MDMNQLMASANQGMGQGQQPMQQPSAEGTGIASGLEEISAGVEAVEQQIDGAEDYEGIMNALRGDKKTVSDRRMELTQYVDKADAEATPESILTILQPMLTILDASNKNQAKMAGGGGQMPPMASGIASLPQAGEHGQQEAMMRMSAGEQPIMRAAGGPVDINKMATQRSKKTQESEDSEPVPSSSGSNSFKNLSTLFDLVPESTSYEEYYSRLKSSQGDGTEGLKVNPYKSLIALGGVVGSSAKGDLFKNLLKPENLSSITDPIVEMAQAKTSHDVNLKQQASESAAKSKEDRSSQISELIVAGASELLKDGSKIIKTEGGGIFRIDQDGKMETLQAGSGPPPFGSPEIGYWVIDPKTNEAVNKVPPIGGKAANIEVFGSDVSGRFYFDENGEKQTIHEGTGPAPVGDSSGGWYEKKSNGLFEKVIPGKDPKATVIGDSVTGIYSVSGDGKEVTTLKEGSGEWSTSGTAEGGYFAFNNSTGEYKTLKDASGKEVSSDLSREIGALNEANKILRDPKIDKNSDEYYDALTTSNVLNAKLDPKGEFQDVLEGVADDLMAEAIANGSSQKKAESIAQDYTHLMNQNWLASKTAGPRPLFDPNKAISEVFAKLYAKQVDGIAKQADISLKLSNLSDIASEASENFNTGLFAGARQTVLKLFKETGIDEDRIPEYLKGSGNDVASSEVLESIGSQFAVFMAGNFPGNLNQSEVDLIKSIGPSMYKSKGGIEALKVIFNRLSERAIAEQNISLAFNEDPNSVGLSAQELHTGLQRKISEYRKNNPLVTREMVDAAIGGNKTQFTRFYPSGKPATLNKNQNEIFELSQSSQTLEAFTLAMNNRNKALGIRLDKPEFIGKMYDNFRRLTSKRN